MYYFCPLGKRSTAMCSQKDVKSWTRVRQWASRADPLLEARLCPPGWWSGHLPLWSGPRERHVRCGPMIVEDSPPLTLNGKTFSRVGHYSHPDCASESHSVVSDSLWPHRLCSPWNSLGQNTGVGSLSLLQGTFPTQGSNPGLLYCRRILYQLSHQGSPRILEWVAYPFSSGSSQPRNRTGVSCILGRFFTSWATRELWWPVNGKWPFPDVMSQERTSEMRQNPPKAISPSQKCHPFLPAFHVSIIKVPTWWEGSVGFSHWSSLTDVFQHWKMILQTPISSRGRVRPYLSGEAPGSPVRSRCVLNVLWAAVTAAICIRLSRRHWRSHFWQQIDSSFLRWLGYNVRRSILMTDTHVRRLNWMRWNLNWLLRCRHRNIKKRERSHRLWTLTAHCSQRSAS